jgi:HAE1 family hydrophobic/amphiphilic exporter-1
MFLPNLAIRRPVFIVMQVLAVLILGILSYTRIGIDLMPDVQFPFLGVSTIYPGASAQEMENLVTKPLEEALSSVNGLKNIYSTSGEGFSFVSLEYELDTKIRDADADARQKISEVRSKLPDDAEEPTVLRFDPASSPIMVFVLSGNLPLDSLRELADKKVKTKMEQVKGVASVDLAGGLEREVWVELDYNKLASLKISPQQIINSLALENLNVPGGRINQSKREITLRTVGEFKNIEEIKKVVVTNREGIPIYLNDIATVRDTLKEQTRIAKLNGKPSVSFIVRKQSGTNTVKVCDALKEAVGKVEKELSSGISIEIASDQSKFIKMSVKDTMRTLYLGAFFATLVILIFLGNFRSTIIAALAIPSSILAAFMLMYAFGFTLNMMTLMALSLAVGILIDDAIVVRENIYRHLEEGMDPEEAASFGTSEVGLAVMATTFTLVAVFVPVGYLGGIVGKFFKAFAFTIVFAILYSLWDSFTMAPMLSAKFLTKKENKNPHSESLMKKLFSPIEKFYQAILQGYKKILNWSLHHKIIVLSSATILFLLSLGLTAFIGKEFMTTVDRDEFRITLETPVGASLSVTEKIVSKIENYLLTSNKDVKIVFSTTGGGQSSFSQAQQSNYAEVYVSLVSKKERKKTTEDTERKVREILKDYPGVTSKVMFVGSFEAESQQPLELWIKGPDIDILDRLSERVLEITKNIPGVVDADRTVRTGKPELRVIVNRDKASQLGLSTGMIASTLRVFVNGEVATKLRQGEKEIDIRVILSPEQRNNLPNISSLELLTPLGETVPLKSVAQVMEDTGPTEISRYNRERIAMVTANVVKERPLGDIIKELNTKLPKLSVPLGYKIEIKGYAEMMTEMFSNMLLALGLAIFFIYVVLASQFNSFLHPFTIMLALPLAVVGALLAVFLFGFRLNMMTMIGIFLLLGIVNKNSILLIDYTITLRKRGMDRLQALLTAGPIRFRPIVMTSAAMIMGMLPIALGIGEAASFRQVMGVTVIGGLITSTLLTLIVVPISYTIIDDIENFLKRKKKS